MTRTPTKMIGSKRLYEWRGESFWSVTTIVSGGLPKPVLVNWAKKFTAEYAVNNIAKLNALLEPDSEGQVDEAGAVDWLKGAAYRDRDKKAEIGSQVHDAIEAYVLGRPMPKWPPVVAPRMKVFERFLAERQPVFTEGMTEASVFNRAEVYAGRLDAICHIGGARLLLDIKTGGVYPEVALQLAAYRFAEFIGGPDGSETPMPEVDGAVVLHLPDDVDYDLIEIRADAEMFQAFLYCREVFKFVEEQQKTVILGPYPATLESAGLGVAV